MSYITVIGLHWKDFKLTAFVVTLVVTSLFIATNIQSETKTILDESLLSDVGLFFIKRQINGGGAG